MNEQMQRGYNYAEQFYARIKFSHKKQEMIENHICSLAFENNPLDFQRGFIKFVKEKEEEEKK